ncbi:nucleoprotein TPR-like [Tachysurus fulvidraco]|uniref:nucleoprotein TPR-like n=1 Tax=Tachysurus fulvidraco TaxID=1234273 RepID=UPI000F4D8E54|nr:nucleoprotein TPR-like [Tachysurus fulvidraco]
MKFTMRHLGVLLGSLVAFTLLLMVFVYSRSTLEFELTKTNYFKNVNNKVTSDVLKETKSNIDDTNKRLMQKRKRIQELTKEIKAFQEAADGKKAMLNTCNNDLSQIKAEIVSLEETRSKSDTEFQQKKSDLIEQINKLKTELEKRSNLCNYINKRSVEGMKLCGIVAFLQS